MQKKIKLLKEELWLSCTWYTGVTRCGQGLELCPPSPAAPLPLSQDPCIIVLRIPAPQYLCTYLLVSCSARYGGRAAEEHSLTSALLPPQGTGNAEQQCQSTRLPPLCGRTREQSHGLPRLPVCSLAGEHSTACKCMLQNHCNGQCYKHFQAPGVWVVVFPSSIHLKTSNFTSVQTLDETVVWGLYRTRIFK